eukprot:2289217-Prymnesium_polylepis.1
MAHEVSAEMRSAAISAVACGTFQSICAFDFVYSAKPLPTKHTASPTATLSTPSPIADTIPTPSAPSAKPSAASRLPSNANSPRARK